MRHDHTTNTAASPLTPAFTLIILATAARIAYHILLSPFELTDDEAHYWEWSRNLDWSYYSKGPGIALCIRAATTILGADAPWAIRTVPAVSFAIVAACMAILAQRAAPETRRAPLFAAIAALLIPGFQGAALLATIDAPFLACWAAGTLAFQFLDSRLRAGRPTLAAALAFGVIVGAGILAKYTMLLLPMGLLIFHLIDPPGARTSVRIRGAAVTLIAAAIVASPIAIWNAQRGWPTVRHLLGHLGVFGSDIPRDAAQPWVFNPVYPLEFIGAQIALVGPLIFLMALAIRRSNQPTTPGATETPHHSRRTRAMLTCAGLPLLILYLGVSLLNDAEGNWALPAYVTLAVLAAIEAARAFEHRVTPGASPRRFLWNAFLVYALIVAAGIPALPALARIPALEPLIPLGRVSGHRANAEALAAQLRDLPADTIILADRYQKASQMAYNLHRILGNDAPLTTSAMSLLNDRPNAYDFWPHTNPRNPALFGRDAILLGSGSEKWARYIRFDAIDPAGPDAPYRVGRGYRGPRTEPVNKPPQ